MIATVLAFVYYKYRGLDAVKAILASIRPVIIAMIASAGITLLKLSLSVGSSALIIFLIAFVAGRFLKVKGRKISPISVIAASGVLGLVLYGAIGISL